MKYIAAVFILISLIYILSFAKYNIGKKNKTAAAGAILLAFLIVVLPVIVMLIE